MASSCGSALQSFAGLDAHCRGRTRARATPRPGPVVCTGASSAFVSGMHDIVGRGRYKGLLLDQFGVLHDGRRAYPAALDCVERLHSAGLRLFIISNSSRRASTTLKRLSDLGFDPVHFAGAITSGEITHAELSSRAAPWAQQCGTRALHFTWAARGAVSLAGTRVEVVTDVGRADFVLAHGTEALGTPDGGAEAVGMEALMALLPIAAQRGLPLVVANPDVVTVDGAAGLKPMPGVFAARYAELGGTVHLMGKPARIIYETALDRLGLPRGDVLAVGDSLEHDIRGAESAGLDSVLVASGIHAAALGVRRRGDAPTAEALANLVAATGGHRPTHAIAEFAW